MQAGRIDLHDGAKIAGRSTIRIWCQSETGGQARRSFAGESDDFERSMGTSRPFVRKANRPFAVNSRRPETREPSRRTASSAGSEAVLASNDETRHRNDAADHADDSIGHVANRGRMALSVKGPDVKWRRIGGVAQWLEQGLHKAKVTGSSPVAAISCGLLSQGSSSVHRSRESLGHFRLSSNSPLPLSSLGNLPMAVPLFSELDAIAARIRAAPHLLLFCDFDGALAPVYDHPSAATLSAEVRLPLADLAASGRVTVTVSVAGRRMTSDALPTCRG